jgi:uncharacterized protein YbcI
MAEQEAPERRGDSPLVELSNAMVALHREHFGRGPAAARSFIVEGMAICVLTDVYTRVERTLIEAGRLDHVRETRLLHQRTQEHKYIEVAESVLGRRVISFLSAVNAEPDIAVEIFLLGERLDASLAALHPVEGGE